MFGCLEQLTNRGLNYREDCPNCDLSTGRMAEMLDNRGSTDRFADMLTVKVCAQFAAANTNVLNFPRIAKDRCG
jgi:hypothetical protein